jgi:PBP1b-binding outer membrane lipoprotein LpoB
MKKLLLAIGVAMVLTGCSTTNFATHKVSETPTMKRQVYIFDDYVEIHTRTRMSVEQYNKIVATTVNNRDERN